jgi:hypothetical protein
MERMTDHVAAKVIGVLASIYALVDIGLKLFR